MTATASAVLIAVVLLRAFIESLPLSLDPPQDCGRDDPLTLSARRYAVMEMPRSFCGVLTRAVGMPPQTQALP